ncbi:hypothetical protein CISG_07972 [Coccidioides immitis RMSCC 3703]|uniref:Uncharacterized protein n=2 Tax=Coccidioides immitis TaxID=5501 RepID=A0A0J8U121_COCIT|nr:hypothetical protein CIRG_03757 [Coccidioides immitis RMSCC 2394]KMU80022.1 hypothetical protein CISG_07972 [Coccidioides immitis RMSCC 3703]
MDSHLSGIWPLVGGVRFGAVAGEKCPDCAAVLEPEEFSICCMKQGTLASWLGNVTTWPSDGTERFGSSIKHPEPHARRNETRETDPPSLHTLSVRRHQPVLPAVTCHTEANSSGRSYHALPSPGGRRRAALGFRVRFGPNVSSSFRHVVARRISRISGTDSASRARRVRLSGREATPNWLAGPGLLRAIEPVW